MSIFSQCRCQCESASLPTTCGIETIPPDRINNQSFLFLLLFSLSLSLSSHIDSHLIFETNFNFLVLFYSLSWSLYLYPISLPYLCLMKWNKTFTRKSFLTLNCPLRFSISDRYIHTYITQSYSHALTHAHTHTLTRDTHTLKMTAFDY